VSIHIQLEPLLALVAGVAALILPPKIGSRVVGAYLVIWSSLEMLGYI
jgi:hypothetical protein